MTDPRPDSPPVLCSYPHARLPEGWRQNVLLEWNAEGMLTAVTPDSAAPRGVAQARGPVIPGMPNLHSHAFQRAMAGLTEYRAGAADSFWSWRDLMYRFAARITPHHLAGVLRIGYTLRCSSRAIRRSANSTMCTTHPTQRYENPAEMAERVVDAAQRAGIGHDDVARALSITAASGGKPRAPGSSALLTRRTPCSKCWMRLKHGGRKTRHCGTALLRTHCGRCRPNRCTRCSTGWMSIFRERRSISILPNKPQKSMRACHSGRPTGALAARSIRCGCTLVPGACDACR